MHDSHLPSPPEAPPVAPPPVPPPVAGPQPPSKPAKPAKPAAKVPSPRRGAPVRETFIGVVCLITGLLLGRGTSPPQHAEVATPSVTVHLPPERVEPIDAGAEERVERDAVSAAEHEELVVEASEVIHEVTEAADESVALEPAEDEGDSKVAAAANPTGLVTAKTTEPAPATDDVSGQADPEADPVAPAMAAVAEPLTSPRRSISEMLVSADAGKPLTLKPPAAAAHPACDPAEMEPLGTALLWAESPAEAAKLAEQQEKLVFLIHVSGNFAIPGFT